YGVMVELFLKLYAVILSGKRKEAILLQNDINEIITILCSGHGNMYAVIKEVLRRRNNINIGGVRKPLADIIESDDAIIKTAIEKLDLAYQKHLLSE
ncbi:MAG: N-acetylneuraminate lyase, partial [Clostridiales bacterium]|nr:N-acetylneuraminate lyase [Clostridiales bacterium]